MHPSCNTEKEVKNDRTIVSVRGSIQRNEIDLLLTGYNIKTFVWYLCFRYWDCEERYAVLLEPVKEKEKKRRMTMRNNLRLWLSFCCETTTISVGAKFYQCPISFLLTTTLHNVVIGMNHVRQNLSHCLSLSKMTKEKISSFVSCQKGLENDSFCWFPVLFFCADQHFKLRGQLIVIVTFKIINYFVTG